MDIYLQKYKGFKVKGYSRAAHRTGVIIEGLDIVLDAGLDVQKSFSNIFITHSHYDHVLFLPQYVFNTNDKQKINVISSKQILDNIEPWFIEGIRMTHNLKKTLNSNTIFSIAKTKFTPLELDNFYEFYNGREKWKVESVKCFHSVDSIGFGFEVEKNRLKEEYSNLSQKEIKQLKKDNIEITLLTFEKIFIFLGDTDKRILLNENIYEYPTIIIECTYLYEDEKKLAQQNKHINWNDIKDIIINKKEIQFILIHFSMKYTQDEIKHFFDKQNLSNLYYLI
jgi:ribonuclease Z